MKLSSKALPALLALVFAAPAAAAPTVSEFDIPTPASGAWDITLGPDGNLWFLEKNESRIGRVVPGDPPVIKDYPTVEANAGPEGIAVGPDGKVWYTETAANRVARFTPGDPPTDHESFGGLGIISGQGLAVGGDGNIWVVDSNGNQVVVVKTSDGTLVEDIPLDAGFGGRNIALGPDGNMWVTGFGSEKIARISGPPASATVDYFTLPTGHTAWDIASGSDGNLWYTAQGTRVGRITPLGAVSPFTSVGTDPFGITLGADGAMWYAEFASHTIGRVAPDGTTTQVGGLVADAGPRYIAAGPGQTLWFTEATANKIGRITGIVEPGGGPGPTPTPTPTPDVTRPNVTGFRVTRRVFRLGGLGTVIRWTLSEDARVTIRFQRRVRGRWRRVPRRVMRFESTAGAHRLRFRGRVSLRRPLRPGRYRMTLTARDAAGNVSAPDRARFRLLPRRRR